MATAPRGPSQEDAVIDELDGVLAAPDHHKVLFENDEVRVLETVIRAGDTTPMHTHRRPTVSYVISGSHFVRRDEAGLVLVDTHADPSFEPPRVVFTPALPPHTLENTGGDDIVIIGVELKHGENA
jgi:mannose-6-phosphate isomerase-like protein (cupin superfamily)